MTIPTRSDWGDIDENDLDAQWALKQFLGKTFADAEAMFAENALYYQEDLQSMSAAPLNFYAPALAKYLNSDRSHGDSDGASSFLHTLIWILKTRPEIFTSDVKGILIRTAKRIANRQVLYDADVNIYGQFSDLYSEIRRLNMSHGD